MSDDPQNGRSGGQGRSNLRLVFDAMAAGLAVADPETRRLLEANPAVCRLFGYSRQEFLERRVDDIHPPDVLPRVLEAFQMQMRGERPVARDLPCLRKDGTVFLADVAASRVVLGGRPCALGIFHDVTERAQAEQALRQGEARYRAVVEAQTELVCRFEPGCTLTFVNEAYCRYFQSSAERLVGFNFLPLIPPEDREAVAARLARITPEHPVVAHEHRALAPSGEVRWMRWTNRGIFDDEGRLLEVQAVGRDITERLRAEDALRESEARYRAVVEDQTELICRFTPDRRVLFVNEAVCRFLGRPRDEVLRGDFVPRVHPDDRPRVLEALESLSPAQPVETHENRTVLPSGEVRWVQWTNRGIFDEAGRLVEVQAVGRDVTEHRRAEQALRQSEANYRAIFNAVSDMVFVHDIETGDVVDFNARVAETYGYRPDEVALLNEQFRRAAEPPYTHADQQRWVRRAAEEGPQRFEWRSTARDGRRFWVEVSLRRAAIGGRDRVLAVLRDISARKRAEEALRRSEENYRLLFEQSLSGIAVVLPDGRIVRASPALAEMFRLPPGELAGRSGFDLIHPADRPRATQRIQELLQGRRAEEIDQYRIVRADGSEGIADVRAKVIDWEGRPALQIITHDITERVRLEEELHQALKMEALGQLAGGIAHDFNNLMTGILCHAGLLRTGTPSPADVRETADLIEGAARRASELTSQLLGLARRGKQQDVPVDLGAAVDTSVRLLSRSLDPRIVVRTDLGPAPVWARGDPVQVEQVILNLAMNARDAMPEGGQMTFAAAPRDLSEADCAGRPAAHPGRYAVLSVSDTGVGIPPDVRARVFEPFFTTKPDGRGTGMGLAMVYGIVRNHGGWVEVESEPGRGATFRVFLPASEPPAEAEPPPAEADLRAPAGAGRVLVVDDEPLVRNAVVRTLTGLGYDVATASTGQEAVEYYRRAGADVDLVVIDMLMPGMDGQACFAALRCIDPDVRAVLSTGWDSDEAVQGALRAGMVGLVRKPFQPRELAAAVKQALGG